MKLTFVVIIFYVAMLLTDFFINTVESYYHAFIDNKVNEKITELKRNGKPAYCSFYQ